MERFATRRLLLRGVAATALAAAVPRAFAQQGEPMRFFLTADEARFLTAAVDRILPKDEWPSASEAGVVDYIDLQLATGWGQGEGQYLGGPQQDGIPQQGYQLTLTPAELLREAIAGAQALGDFVALADADKDAFLQRCQHDEIRLGTVPGGAFFRELRTMTMEGYFADPAYNGNRDAVGWRMIGFPGAHAYYLTEIDRHGLDYRREPTGMGWQPGLGEVRPFLPAAAPRETQ